MHILVVEDDQVTLRLMEKKLKKWGYDIHQARNGMEAWEMVKSDPVDLIVTDWMMPEMDGLELCRHVRDARFKRYIYIILVTSRDTQQDVVHGLEGGADDYITKPINFEELRARIEIGLRIVRLERDATRRYSEMKRNYFQTIHMFTNLMEVFDADLGGHSRRVAELSLKLAKRFPDVSEKDYRIVEAAGLLHDIGMVGLPNEILTKKRTEMTGDEKQLYMSHPVRGEIILNEIEFLRPVAKLVRAHHEQFNGRGFPDGLEGNKIPLFAKIVSAASVYDNLVHRGKVPLEEIPDHLQRMRRYQLEPAIVDHLLELNLENIQEEGGKEFFECVIDDLQEGMMLSKDVRTKTGAFVLPADTEITGHGIEKLKGYRSLDSIGKKIFVHKWSVRG